MSRFLTKILNEKPGGTKIKLEAVPHPDPTQTVPKRNLLDGHKPDPVPDQFASQIKSNLSGTIAPEKDFNKRANVLERNALPDGLFPGASKAIYDALYLRTIGSVNPQRTIQATRKELMKWSGIKNVKTINIHLKKLKDLELVKITNFTGEHTGSHYEVFLPKESPDPTQTSQTGGRPDPNRKSGPDQARKSVWVGLGNLVENKGTYEFPKTSLKTNTNDDDYTRETFALLNEKLRVAAERLTGKKSSKNEIEKWGNLADLLILEMEMAAKLTDSISSAPAFLTEVLRRKLFIAPPKIKSANNSKTKTGTIEKSSSESYQIKPLDAKEREATLEQLREFAEDDFLNDFKKWYTEEDWRWLMKELKVNNFS